MGRFNGKNISIFSLLKYEKVKIFIGILLGIISGLLSFVPYVVLYQMILSLINKTLNIHTVLIWALIMVIGAIVQNVLMSATMICTHVAAYNIMHRLKMEALEYLSKVNLGFFNNKSTGELKAALFDDIEKLEGFIAHNLVEIIQAIVIPVIAVVLMLRINVYMTLAMIIPVIVGVFLPTFMMRKYPDLTRKYTNTFSEVMGVTNEYVNCMPIIKMFGLTADKFVKLSKSSKKYTECLKEMAKCSCYPLAFMIVILDSGVLFTLPIGGYLYLNKLISSEEFLVFMLLTMCFYRTFFNLFNIAMGRIELNSGLVNIKQLFSVPVEKNGEKRVKSKSLEIEFENVNFGYDENNLVLKNISMKIEPNSFTAFVGESGAGKTTAATLIGRYWNVDSGEIRISGIPINELNTDSLMASISFVFQDVFMMEDTLLENIRMGLNVNEEEVHLAAQNAQIHDFISGLPDGYNTKIGDKGFKLSGGQKQRISIARAILKNAPIIIFDEATSYSDIENEHKIQIALENLLKNKTVIMIAHRLHTIKNADKIVVFEKGKIVEQGTHKILLDLGGHYADMWNIYMQNYVE
ncbi:ABC transporter ATP-binding protein [Fusobacterium necrophorum]|uniref:Multidrug ABC transporter n=2 Tax=Fusobacterium necrophorum TaxID=859 RepID=A0AB73BX33_9FUSO|nr:ABC transporter ATP-binding protein [Fusobacterium necrophorum]AYZ74611.1 ABC transporter ATP-binding protein [Fusobacterium necrophorum]AZW09504.1 ABC transporter ATP-binding protein [Fusobacterium necrophorum subsp. necrophorum]KDE63854.1 multidrug ABC transporter [Fusobacterium necrophorum BL]KDE70230.1 multidrug ABC transporter [Fusobacterium necrophorum BFTR-2]SDB14660.1 ATP-binding cassette, subfamily B [Fusobacterium necrophorum]